MLEKVIENDEDNYKISLAEALDLMMEAWKSVSADTIQKCFRLITAGIDLTEDLAALDNTISKITVKLGRVVTGILYLQVDQNLDTRQEMRDDDLVEELKKSLAGEVEQDSEDEEKPPHIPVSEAVKAVQILSCFVEQEEKMGRADADWLRGLLMRVRACERFQQPHTDLFLIHEKNEDHTFFFSQSFTKGFCKEILL